MVKIILIEKTGNIKSSVIKNFDKDALFKKCGFRNRTNFSKETTWNFSSEKKVDLYAKSKGRAGGENKYDLPPPVDSKLYFGSLLLVGYKGDVLTNDNVEDITVEEWRVLYEKLFGGFEDLGNEDSFSEEEEIPKEFKTKQGYSKEDGFVVDDDNEDNDGDDDDEEEEDYIEEDQSNDDESEEDEDSNAEVNNIGSDTNDTEDEKSSSEEEEEDDDDIDDIGSELSEEEYD